MSWTIGGPAIDLGNIFRELVDWDTTFGYINKKFKKWLGVDLVNVIESGLDVLTTSFWELPELFRLAYMPGKEIFEGIQQRFNEYFGSLMEEGGGKSGVGKQLYKIIDLFGEKATKKGAKAVGKGIGIMGGLYGRLLSMSGVMEALGPLMEMIGVFGKMIGASLMKALMPAMQMLMDLISDPEMQQLLQSIGQIIANTILPVFQVIVPLLKAFLPIINLLADGLKVLTDLFVALIGWLFGQSPGLIPAFRIVTDVIIKVVNVIFNSFVKIFEIVINLFITISKVIGDIADIIGNVLIAAFESVAWVFYYVADSIVVVINTIIGTINAALGWIGVSLDKFDRPTPPKLAEGGIVTGPTIAMIGEEGPEAVVPLNRGGGMGNITIEVKGNIYGEDELMGRVVDELEKRKRLGVI